MKPRQLLEQAERLVGDGPGRPRQADLRRAVSAAYYALFHLLTQATAARATTSADLRFVVARSIDHRLFKEASERITNSSFKGPLAAAAGDISPDLELVAQAVVDLQDARHKADYDLHPDRDLTRGDARTLIVQVRNAFAAWERVRTEPAAEVYLLAILLKLNR